MSFPGRKLAIAGALLIALGATAAAQTPRHERIRPDEEWVEDFDPAARAAAPAHDAATTAFGIEYHGGPIMTAATGDASVNVYFIWYGNWTDGRFPSDSSRTRDLLSALFSSTGLNNSGLLRITQSYTDGNDKATSSLLLVKQVNDSYSRGARLRDADVTRIVSNAITNGTLPNDPHGMYFVLTSSDVSELSGFCTKYCGWHNSGIIGGNDIKYAFVGNPDRCPNSCAAQSVSPNGNTGADAMASTMTHEAVETITDPDGNAWFDAQGNEMGDKCSWRFGPTQTTPDGARYNQTFANYHFLIQSLWSNSSDPLTGRRGGCAQSAGAAFHNY